VATQAEPAQANEAPNIATSQGPAAGGVAAEANGAPAANPALDFGALRQVPMTLHVEIGRTVMTLGEILDELDVGSTIRLDRHAGDPVEVYVNGALFARAEVVVVQDQLGVKIIELIDPAQGLRPSGLR
jgi:flagellar motor switch protein FliN/FliY